MFDKIKLKGKLSKILGEKVTIDCRESSLFNKTYILTVDDCKGSDLIFLKARENSTCCGQVELTELTLSDELEANALAIKHFCKFLLKKYGLITMTTIKPLEKKSLANAGFIYLENFTNPNTKHQVYLYTLRSEDLS